MVLDGVAIRKTLTCKYLGLILDAELKWTEHIDAVYKKLIKFVGIFYKLQCKLPAATRRLIYFAFVHCHILYCVELYANTHMSYLDKLIKLNNKLLRILQNRPYNTPSCALYRRYHTLSIDKLHIHRILVLAHKIIHHRNLLPSVFFHYFTFNNAFHCYNTRAKDDIHIIQCQSLVGQKCLRYKLRIMWNSLPVHLKLCMSVFLFNSQLKRYLTFNDI